MFLQACVDAGPDACALYEPTASAIHARIHRLFEKLKASPVPVDMSEVPYPLSVPYGLIDYKAVKALLFLFLYIPYDNGMLSAPRLAAALRDLENGDGVKLWGVLGLFALKFTCECPVPGHPLPPIPTPDTQHAIYCTDGDQISDTVEDLQKKFALLAKESEFADVFQIAGTCM